MRVKKYFPWINSLEQAGITSLTAMALFKKGANGISNSPFWLSQSSKELWIKWFAYY